MDVSLIFPDGLQVHTSLGAWSYSPGPKGPLESLVRQSGPAMGIRIIKATGPCASSSSHSPALPSPSHTSLAWACSPRQVTRRLQLLSSSC